MLLKPVIALGVFSALLLVLWLIFPSLFRLIRTSLFLIWNKLRMPGHREPVSQPVELPKQIDAETLGVLSLNAKLAENEIAWSMRCITGKSKGWRGLGSNRKATLTAASDGRRVFLVLKKPLRDRLLELPLPGAKIASDPRFLSDNLVIEHAARTLTLRFPRGHYAEVETLAIKLRDIAGPASNAAPAIEPVNPAFAPVPAIG